MSETFEEFEKSLLEFGSTAYDGLADDDDPMGHCHIVGEDGDVTVMAIAGDMFAPENLKTLFMGVCAEIVKTKAIRVGWLVSAYKVTPGDGPPPPANFADDPRRVEVYECMIVEADRVAAHQALILRSPSRVGDWESKDYAKNPYIEIPQRALATVARGTSEMAG